MERWAGRRIFPLPLLVMLGSVGSCWCCEDMESVTDTQPVHPGPASLGKHLTSSCLLFLGVGAGPATLGLIPLEGESKSAGHLPSQWKLLREMR